MEPLISVIVPVYKVEPYLPQCLDSLLAQSYKNLEIILVDDGSPDRCGAICDDYAARDGRIRVIHTEHGGVSSARNAALAAAAGEWIGWVDGDDWIEAEMFEHLLKGATEHHSDIAVCGRVEEYPDKAVPWGWDEVQVWDRERALGLLLEDKAVRSYLCDKLWRKELFAGITFPEGRIFEDLAVIFQLFCRAETVVAIPQTGYHYRQWSESIVGRRTLTQQVDFFRAVYDRLEALKADWPQYVPLLEIQCSLGCQGAWGEYTAAPRAVRKALRPQLREMARFAKESEKRVLANAGQGLAGRLLTRLTAHDAWWAFTLAGIVRKQYVKKHPEEGAR